MIGKPSLLFLIVTVLCVGLVRGLTGIMWRG